MPLLALLAMLSDVLPDTGAVLYAKWCGACHGADGRGGAKSMTRLEVAAPDLASCAISSAETELLWTGIVRDGGEPYGLSMDMPAFGDGASEEQILAIVRYVRSLCGNPTWPPGELNFPRAHFSEKAFPENELVIATRGREQALIYERRLGPRFQLEAVGRTILDGGSVFGSASAGLKYNLWHSVAPLAIVSLGIEATPPLGRQDEWELEPFVAFGSDAGRLPIQGELLATFEDGFAALTVNLGAGRDLGRFVPMLEGSWSIPRNAGSAFSLVPQLWMQLSRLGHVAASIGLEIPVAGPQPRGETRLVLFMLWDFVDGPLTAGW